MKKADLAKQRHRLEQCRKQFERGRSAADVLKGRRQSALKQLEKFGATSLADAKGLLRKEKSKEEKMVAGVARMLDELENEMEMEA